MNHEAISESISALVARVRAGETRAVARAVSLVENRSPEAPKLLSALFPYAGKSLRIGITGAPGAGKSTLVDHLARHYRQSGKSVGIVAVDPTSPYTGGAILGDRIRMQAHHADVGLYLRSMATRGTMGGLAGTTAEVCSVIEASGKDILLIETVGVGQDEIDIVRLADVTLVTLVPGMGDDVQSIKAGIMEIAGIFVLNKSDRDGADRVEREIRTMQSLVSNHGVDDWIPPVVRTIASEGTGIGELAAAIETYRAFAEQHGILAKRRAEAWRTRLLEMLRRLLVERFVDGKLGAEVLAEHARLVAEQREDPYTLVAEWMSSWVANVADEKSGFSELGLAQVKIDHLGIAVRSIVEARRIYESLGISVQQEETVEHEKVHTAMLPIGDSRIELLEATGPDSVIAKFLAKRGEGIHHVALQVPAIRETFAAFERSGIRTVSKEIKIGAGGHLYFFVHPTSANGVLIEIVQAPSGQ